MSSSDNESPNWGNDPSDPFSLPDKPPGKKPGSGADTAPKPFVVVDRSRQSPPPPSTDPAASRSSSPTPIPSPGPTTAPDQTVSASPGTGAPAARPATAQPDKQAAAPQINFELPPPEPEHAPPIDPPKPAPPPPPKPRTIESVPLAPDEYFADPTAFKIGILGGRASGKTYLFNSLLYRVADPRRSGALTPFLARNPPKLYRAGLLNNQQGFDDPSQLAAERIRVDQTLQDYTQWIRLDTTRLFGAEWYKIRMATRAGFLGGGRRTLDVEFLDAPGEWLEREFPPTQANISKEDHDRMQIWRMAYLEAKVLIFCLPAWALFPTPAARERHMSQGGRSPDEVLEAFKKVLFNYEFLRQTFGIKHKVKVVLALTMADDDRFALDTVKRMWIRPYSESRRAHRKFMKSLQSFRGGGSIARYLDHARQVSHALTEAIASMDSNLHSALADQLYFEDDTPPWLLPVSAIHGQTLDDRDGAGEPHSADPPQPVHVELPLLLALCARDNALM
jgi:hypothetical protein